MTQKLRVFLVVCKGCGKRFHPKDRRQKYCVESCREAYYERHYFTKTTVSKTCPNCGTMFSTTMPKKQSYCNEDCREDARKKRADVKSASAQAERVTYRSEVLSTLARDEYKCTRCGKGLLDGVTLDVVEEDANLVTVCTDCKIGKETE